MRLERKHVQKVKMDAEVVDQSRARVFLSYIMDISKKISRACKLLGVQTVFTSRNTLRKFLMKVKGRLGMIDVKCIVYLVPYAKVQQLTMERLGRCCKSVWQRTDGRSRTRILVLSHNINKMP